MPPRRKVVVQEPGLDASKDKWLEFALAEPSTEERPRADLKNQNLAWLLEAWTFPERLDSLRSKLAAPLSVLQLTKLYSEEKALSFDQISTEHYQSEDKALRTFFQDNLSLYMLVKGWESARRKLDEIRAMMWSKLKEKIQKEDFAAYPMNMSADLQRMVIRNLCREDAVFIEDLPDDKLGGFLDEQLGFSDEVHGYYLNHPTRKASVCNTVRNINILRHKRIQERLAECQKLIANSTDNKLESSLESNFKENLQKYLERVAQWQSGNPYCEGSGCQVKMENLAALAKEVSDFSDTCKSVIAKAKESRKKERSVPGSGEKPLSWRERFGLRSS